MKRIATAALLLGAWLAASPAPGQEAKKDGKILPGAFSGAVSFITNYHFRCAEFFVSA